MNIIHRVYDDSYVITKNGMPYHVYPYAAEFAEEWDAVFAYAEAHPECVTEEQPYGSLSPIILSCQTIRSRKTSLKESGDTANPCAIFHSSLDSLGMDQMIWGAHGLYRQYELKGGCRYIPLERHGNR